MPDFLPIPPDIRGSVDPDSTAYYEGAPWHATEGGREQVRQARRAKFAPKISRLPEPPSYYSPQRSVRSEPTALQRDRLAQKVQTARTASQPIVPDHYLVSWKESAFPYALPRDGEQWAERVHLNGRTLNDLSREVVRSVGGELTYTYNVAAAGFAAFLTPAQAEALRQHPDIAAVEPDFIFEDAAYEQPITDPGLWGLDRIDQHNLPGEGVYRYPGTGAGVHAYVVEGGVRFTHQEFSDLTFGKHYGIPKDDIHGTGVASVLGGKTFGVAKQVILHVIYNPNTSSGLASLFGWVITDNELNPQPSVINLSTGFRAPDDPVLFETSIDTLIEAGFVVIAAAGNWDRDISIDPFYPASYTQVLTVGGTDRLDVVWKNINWPGEQPEEHDNLASNYGPFVDIWAPAHGLLVASSASDSDSKRENGTSYSTPMVAGVASMILEQDPMLGHTGVEDALMGNSRSGIISGDLGGAPNRLLFYNGWFYPFHTFAEWENADPTPDCSSGGECWFYKPEMGGWIWTDEASYKNGGWFMRLSDGAWLSLVDTIPCIQFWNQTTQQFENCIPD